MRVSASSILLVITTLSIGRVDAYVVRGPMSRKHDLPGPRRRAGATVHEPGRLCRHRLQMPPLDPSLGTSSGLWSTYGGAGAGQADGDIVASAGGSGAIRTSTCRVCHQSFAPGSNNDRACRYHPGDFLGAENSKYYGVRSGGKITGLSLFYDCCGADTYDAPGCTYARHLTYDD